MKKQYTYTAVNVDRLPGDVYCVKLKSTSADFIEYQAGQYLEILHPELGSRPFSIACAPHIDRLIELHIRDLPDNAFITDLLQKIKNQQPLILNGPHGQNFLHIAATPPLILVAGGTGFAPIKALLEDLVEEKYPGLVHLYWGVRTKADHYLPQIPQQLSKQLKNFKYTPVLSAALPSDQWQGRTGLVHNAVLEDYQDLAEFKVYTSGPPEMVTAARNSFIQRGLYINNIHSDWLDYLAETMKNEEK